MRKKINVLWGHFLDKEKYIIPRMEKNVSLQAYHRVTQPKF